MSDHPKIWHDWRYDVLDADGLSAESIASCIRSSAANGLFFRHWTRTVFDTLSALPPNLRIKSLMIERDVQYTLDNVPSIADIEYYKSGLLRVPVDFCQFANLKHLHSEWSHQLKLPQADSPLEDLLLVRYKPQSENLRELPPYTHLRNIDLIRGSIKSLLGIERFPQLERACMAYIRSLGDVSSLATSPVRQLEFDHCPNVTGTDELGECPLLDFLILSGVKSIPSLQFVKRSTSLRKFTFMGTRVEDGDMSPLLKLDSVYFQDKPHYTHRHRQIVDAVEKRRGRPMWTVPAGHAFSGKWHTAGT